MIEQSEIDKQHAHYQAGLEDGIKQGRKNGFEDGWKQYQSEIHSSIMDGITKNYGTNKFRTVSITVYDKSLQNGIRVAIMPESDYKSEMEGGWW